MSFRDFLRRASNALIPGTCLLFASALLHDALLAQTARQAKAGSNASAQDKQKIAANALKLPLFFEANSGQNADPSVRFLTRSGSYTMFLKPTETVLVGQENRKINGLSRAQDLKSAAPAAAEVRMELLGANPSPQMSGADELPGKVNYLIGNNPNTWHTNVALFGQVRAREVYPGVDLLFHGDQRQLEYDFVVAPDADASNVAFRILGAQKIEMAANGDLVLHAAGSDFRMRKPMIYQAEGAGRREVQGGFVLSARNEVRFELGPYDHAEPLVIDPAINYATYLGGSGADLAEAVQVDTSTPGAPKIYIDGFTTDITTFAEPSTKLGNPSTADSGSMFIAEIDPTQTGAASLVYLTFIGGSTPFAAGAVGCESEAVWLALDTSQGPTAVEPVVGGGTTCSDYPGTVLNPVTATGANAGASVVTRLKVGGAAIDASALLGGNGQMSTGYVFVDTTGDVLLTGPTAATNLPTTSDAYVATFNNGTGAGFYDCYSTKLQRSNLAIAYFTYLNVGAGTTSTSSEYGCGGNTDPTNTNIIYIGGNTVSTVAFSGAGSGVLGFQSAFSGAVDVFLMKLDTSVSGSGALKFATYYGGGDVTEVQTGALDLANGVPGVTLGTGVVALAGHTTSNSVTNPPNIPIELPLTGLGTNPAANNPTAQEAGFVVLIDTTQSGAGSLLVSTYLGGSSGADEIRSLAYDPLVPFGYNIIVGGATQSTDFPVTNAFQGSLVGTQDAFVTSLLMAPGSGLDEILFSSYIGGGSATEGAETQFESVGGIGVDSSHRIYVGASTEEATFFGNTTPATTVNGFQTTCASCGTTPEPDAVIFALKTAAAATVTAVNVFPSAAALGVGANQQFTALGIFSDGTYQDLTESVTWNSSNTAVAEIGANGVADALSAGTTTITATYGGMTSPGVTLTVTGGTGFALTVTEAGTGSGTVTSAPAGISCPSTCSANFAGGTAITLTAVPTTGSTFAGWSGGECSGTGTCVVTLTAATTVTATFNTTTTNFALTVTETGTGSGTVTSAPAGISCKPTCTANFASGTAVVLTAAPAAGSTFAGWGAPCAGTGTCTVTLTAATTVTATFNATTTNFALTVTEAGTGTGTVTSAPAGISCKPTCTANFASGTQVTLTAAPATGSTFAGWSGGGCSGTGTCVVTLTAATTVTATFNTTTTNFALTVTEAGTGSGTVTSAPAGISCKPTCTANFASGTQVTLTQSAAEGSVFAGWSGACSGTGACVVTMSAAEAVTATFNPSNQPVVITVPSGGSTSATTTPGGTAYYGLLITGAAGTSGTVTLTCVSSSPFVTCKVVPSTVVLNGTTATEVAFGIQTYCTGPTNTGAGFVPGALGRGYGGGIALMLMGMLGVATIGFRRQRRLAMTFAMLLVMALGSAACSSLATNPNGATPAGTYTISLTTTLNGSSQTLPNFLTLVVK